MIITKEIAEFVKQLRCIEGKTFRVTCRKTAEKFPQLNMRAGDQNDGIKLCCECEKFLGTKDEQYGNWDNLYYGNNILAAVLVWAYWVSVTIMLSIGFVKWLEAVEHQH